MRGYDACTMQVHGAEHGVKDVGEAMKRMDQAVAAKVCLCVREGERERGRERGRGREGERDRRLDPCRPRGVAVCFGPNSLLG
jgi:hypothetical protein